MSGKPAFSIQVLRSYYPVVTTLHGYLTRIALSPCVLDECLMHVTDTKLYRDLLETCMVAANIEPTDRFDLCAPSTQLRELVEKMQIEHLSRQTANANVLTCGYQFNTAKNGGKHKSTVKPGLHSRFMNTVVTVFESPAWDTLYNRVGDDIVSHLLLCTSMFILLPNACYCQITGKPLVDLTPPTTLRPPRDNSLALHNGQEIAPEGSKKRKREESRVRDIPVRRLNGHAKDPLRGNKLSSSWNTPLRAAAAIAIQRSRMFYYRLRNMQKADQAAFSLPSFHILNRFRVHYLSEGQNATPDTRKQEEFARLLSKYVFPLQYGLVSVFSPDETKGPFQTTLPNYTKDNETKIKGSHSTPKRLKPVLGLLDKLIWRHCKCGYRSLLSKTCPSKVKRNSKKPIDSSMILELMSETSYHLSTQANQPDSSASFGSAERSMVRKALSEARQQTQQKPRFAEFMCSHNEVYCFATAVTKIVIPMQLWGSEWNFKLIMRHVKSFISMRRFETTTLHTLMQGFRVSDCEWLIPPGSVQDKQAKVPISDSLKRLELLQEYIYWYFDSFLIPLLKANFYVTESQAYRNKVLYFRQDDWEVLCRPLVEKLCHDTFQKMRKEDAEQLLHNRKIGYSFVRLLPKETGVRPIINLRRREAKAGPQGQSINQVLKAAFHILSYEKENQKKLLGASVFGPNEIYRKLKAFKATLQQDYAGQTFPKLYFVKMDVQACFDTIDQTKLLQILVNILSENQYIIQRHGQVSAQCDKVRRKFVSSAMPADECPHFLSLASKLASALRHTIFVDKVIYPDAKREEVIHLLEQHITDNIVKIGNDYYRQVIGIPQGSILSTLLCSFFYGDLERSQLKFTEDPHTVLLRLIDDYLLITTDRKRARHFYDVMSSGHHEYGCFISREKTLTNFDDGDMVNVIDPSQQGFPWCGISIDMRDLSVSADCSRWNVSALRDSFTVDFGRRAGASFAQKMLLLGRAKSHMIYNDCDLNSLKAVYKNIYQNFCLNAIKMHFYIRSWKPNVAKSSTFITSTVRQTIRYTYATMRTKATSKLSKTYGARLEAQKAAVIWLGTHAFYTVLSRKSHEYANILKALEFDMRLPQYARHKRHLSGVLKEGLATLAMLDF